jgi:two-component system, response regulator
MTSEAQILLVLAAQPLAGTTPLREVFAQCCPGARVWAVPDGATALRYLMARGEFAARDDRSQPELVVLQAMPPLDDSLALLVAIKEYPGSCAVPVVVVTPEPRDEHLRQCYIAGANSVVADTGDMGDMVNAMGTLHAFWTSVNETLYDHSDGISRLPCLAGPP